MDPVVSRTSESNPSPSVGAARGGDFPADVDTLQARLSTQHGEIVGLNRSLEKTRADLKTARETLEAEMRGSKLVIDDLRAEVQRIREERDNSSRQATLLELKLAAVKAGELSLNPEVNQALCHIDDFVAAQLSALGQKLQRKPKDETLEQKLMRLRDGLICISDALGKEREKHRERVKRGEETQKKLSGANTELESRAETIERLTRKATNLEGSRDETRAENQRIKEEQFRERIAAAELTQTITQLREQLDQALNQRSKKDELLEQLLRQQREAAPAPKPEPTPLPERNLKDLFSLPIEQLASELSALATNPEQNSKFFLELVTSLDGPARVTGILRRLEKAAEELGDGEEVPESQEYQDIIGAEAKIIEGLTFELNRLGLSAFIFKVDSQFSGKLIENLSPELLKEVALLCPMNPDHIGILTSEKALDMINRLPEIIRASLVELCPDNHIALLILYFSPQIRAGVAELNRLFKEKHGNAVDPKLDSSIEAKRILLAKLKGNQKISAAHDAMVVCDIIAKSRLDELVAFHSKDRASISAASAQLGLNFNDVLLLQGMQRV